MVQNTSEEMSMARHQRHTAAQRRKRDLLNYLDQSSSSVRRLARQLLGGKHKTPFISSTAKKRSSGRTARRKRVSQRRRK